jgi:NAD(P)-dependent dehydrogenase (short-subunit alcohol dehydrogenase family)
MQFTTQKTVLLTGGTGGLGGATRDLLLKNHYQVIVADVNREALRQLEGREGLIPVFADVTDTASMEAALAEVMQTTDRLDAVINFAGVLAVGSMLEIEEATLQRLIQVNLMGTYRTNKVFFPLVKAAGGRIINISSETGWQSAAPFNGAYALSKHAIEAYSDALRRELTFCDIPVIKIQPGPFRSEMSGSIKANFQQAANDSKLFPDILTGLMPLAAQEGRQARDPVIVAEAVLNALTTRHPKAAYSVKPALSRSFLEYLPTRLVDWLIKQVLGRMLKNPR